MTAASKTPTIYDVILDPAIHSEEEIQSRLARFIELGEYNVVITHPSTSPEMLKEVMKKSAYPKYGYAHPNFLLEDILKFKSTIDNTKTLVSYDENYREMLRNPNTPYDILFSALRRSRRLAENVALNPNAPAAVLLEITQQTVRKLSSHSAKLEAAKHPHFPQEYADVLEPIVRFAGLSRNPNTPFEKLVQMLVPENKEKQLILQRADLTPELYEQVVDSILDQDDKSGAFMALVHPFITPEIEKRVLTQYRRYYALSSRATLKSVMRYLENKRNPDRFSQILQNQHLDSEMLTLVWGASQQHKGYFDETRHTSIAYHPNAVGSLRNMIAKRYADRFMIDRGDAASAIAAITHISTLGAIRRSLLSLNFPDQLLPFVQKTVHEAYAEISSDEKAYLHGLDSMIALKEEYLSLSPTGIRFLADTTPSETPLDFSLPYVSLDFL